MPALLVDRGNSPFGGHGWFLPLNVTPNTLQELYPYFVDCRDNYLGGGNTEGQLTNLCNEARAWLQGVGIDVE